MESEGVSRLIIAIAIYKYCLEHVQMKIFHSKMISKKH